MHGHTVRSYDQELAHLSTCISSMGGLAAGQLADALTALTTRDAASAARIVAADVQIDDLEQEVQAYTMRLLALRQPMGIDLRHIVAALKISSDIERIGDYAANIAKRLLAMARLPGMPETQSFGHLAELVQKNLKDVLDAYAARDSALAIEVWKRDEAVDDACSALLHDVAVQMTRQPDLITAGTHLLFIAKNIERIGDHTTNIAEKLHFLVAGKGIGGMRPKGHGPGED
jgi:phosphate transport system protein